MKKRKVFDNIIFKTFDMTKTPLYALELLKDHSYKEVIDITGISKATLCRAKQKYSGLRP